MAEARPIATMPTNITYEEASPILEGGNYALWDIKTAKVKSGQAILINGAKVVIGSVAVQVVKYFGVTVTAVCNTKNVELINTVGADVVIDYTKEDFTKRNHTFDFVFDAVGKSSFDKCKPILNKKGIYISTELGKNSQNSFLAIITPLLSGKKLWFSTPTITKQNVIFFRELVGTNKYKPLIDKHHVLDEIMEA